MTADLGEDVMGGSGGGSADSDALSSYSDEELAGLCRQSRSTMPYFSELVYRYFALIKSKAGVFCMVPSAYDDFVQEGMLGLISAMREFSPDKGAKFSSYAYSCIVNRMKTAAAKLSRQQSSEKEEDEEPLCSLTPESIIIEKELFRELESSLSPMEREILLLHMSGFTAEEISARLEVAPKSVDNAVQRARRKLREKLADEGI